jgi:large subunit ribosomal protein L21
MYAVIETGGKQYRVEVGTELAVELLDVEPGQEITLDRVLLVADADEAAVGRPVVDGAAVQATVLRTDRGAKVINFKYKPKTRRRVKKGHRQNYTVLRITDVRLGKRSAAAELAAEDERRALAREQAAEEAATRAAADAALAATLAQKAKAAEEAAEAEAQKPEAPKKPRRRSRTAAPEPEPGVEAMAVAPEIGIASPAVEAEAEATTAEPEATTAEPEATTAVEPAEPAEPAADVDAKPRRAREPKKED